LPGRPSFFLLLEKLKTLGANPKKGEPAALYKYEIALIIRPEVEEEGQAALIERLGELLTSEGGEVADVETWGRRRLAYPIRKVQEGYYYFIQGQFSASVLPELERTIKLNEDVLRHMVIRTDA
jgi:small subunit ribosomal protein S6